MTTGDPSRQNSGHNNNLARWFGGIFVFAAIALLLWRANSPEQPKHASKTRTGANREASAVPAVSAVREELPSAEASGSKQTSAGAVTPDSTSGPEKTRASRRDEVVDASGKRRTQVDPMASWTDQPAWPEGPKMYAEVETSSRRYINLRPDDIGEMPRVRADAEERMELKLTFPEGEPGEKIHVELPNGGTFADSEARGRVYVLPENRTLSFAYLADDSRGHCNVKFLHRGHTRSLPVWVGELPEFATADADP